LPLPLTSVIVVNYNGGELLPRCVEAVLASTAPLELFVIDNASSDGSMAELRDNYGNDARLRIYENHRNLGFAPAANQVLGEACGDYLLFLNPDCLIQPDTLEQFRAAMDSQLQAGMAGPLVRNPDGSEQASSRRNLPDPWRALARVLHLDKLIPGLPGIELTRRPPPDQPAAIEAISGACMFVRRSALDQVGPMDESYFLHCEDLDWFMRFQQHGWQIWFFPAIEVSHAQGTCSRREPIKVLWYKHRGMIKYYRKFLRSRYPLPLYWLIVAAVWTRFSLLAAGLLLKRMFSRSHVPRAGMRNMALRAIL
jgi:GT2 family glycosyltransferase